MRKISRSSHGMMTGCVRTGKSSDHATKVVPLGEATPPSSGSLRLLGSSEPRSCALGAKECASEGWGCTLFLVSLALAHDATHRCSAPCNKMRAAACTGTMGPSGSSGSTLYIVDGRANDGCLEPTDQPGISASSRRCLVHVHHIPTCLSPSSTPDAKNVVVQPANDETGPLLLCTSL